ncbi:MAG: hypothetical protein PHU49_01500 [Syntrophorhabdaceae bacterium]|jgi:hypothetical protein|nr:hypothetical protein [Syntrophorhabdaceae bacterium]
METTVTNYLANLELQGIQQFKNMAVFPVSIPMDGSPQYLTLKEALERRLLVITEISHGGTVPELMAANNADIPVLLLDGEELSGAKQNRVLNTTILLKEHSETIIPVSCTEQGRWSYTSHEFADSGIIMAQKIRREKARTVTDNLKSAPRAYRANQGQVWDDIARMEVDAGVRSSTGAMKDVFQEKEDDMGEYMKAFPHVPGQRGLIVFVNGRVAGFDMVSLESAYAVLHTKLIKSYAMDAYLERRKAEGNYKPSVGDAKAFLGAVQACKEERYESLGHGWDYRYEGQSIVGSALVFSEKVIHMAFFSIVDSERIGNMSGFRRRRGYRTH